MPVTVTPSTFEAAPDGPFYVPPAPGRTSIEEFDDVESEWFAAGRIDGTPYRTSVLVAEGWLLPQDVDAMAPDAEIDID